MKARGNAASSSWQTMIRRPLFLLANLALFITIAASTARETYRGWTVDHEIKSLEVQAAQLEGHRLELESLTKTLVSPEQVDYDARARLGRKKPGERVIVLDGVMATTSWRDDVPADGGAWKTQLPTGADLQKLPPTNPGRWWYYFFHG